MSLRQPQANSTQNKLDDVADDRKTTIRNGLFTTSQRLALVMSGNQRSRTCLAILGVVGITLVAVGQEPAKKTPTRGRLPAHYKELVSPEQREEIYAIQGKFN